MDGEELAPGRESSPGGDPAIGTSPAPGGGGLSPAAPDPMTTPEPVPVPGPVPAEGTSAPDGPASPYDAGPRSEGDDASVPVGAQGTPQDAPQGPDPGRSEDAAPAEPVPAAVWPSRAGVAPTGDERVDGMLARLAEVPGRPIGEHVAVYDDLHHGLQEVLASTGQDESGAEGAEPGAPGGAGRMGPQGGQGPQGFQGGRERPGLQAHERPGPPPAGAGRGPVPGAPWRGPRPPGSR